MSKTINENHIKISGKFPVEDMIELGEDVTFAMKAGCVKKEVTDNNDGSVDVVYVLKPINVIIDKKLVYQKN